MVSLVLRIFLFCFDCLLLLMLLALGKKDILICSCVWWCKKAGKSKDRVDIQRLVLGQLLPSHWD